MDFEKLKQEKEQKLEISGQTQGASGKEYNLDKVGNIYNTIMQRLEHNKKKIHDAKVEAERVKNGQDIRGTDFFMLLMTMGIMHGFQAIANALKELKAEVVYSYYQMHAMRDNIIRYLIKHPDDIKEAFEENNNSFKAKFIRAIVNNSVDLKHFMTQQQPQLQPQPPQPSLSAKKDKDEDMDTHKFLEITSEEANKTLKPLRGYIERGEPLPDKIVREDGKVVEIPKDIRDVVKDIDELEKSIKEGLNNFSKQLASNKDLTVKFLQHGKNMAQADNLHDATADAVAKGYEFILAPERILSPERTVPINTNNIQTAEQFLKISKEDIDIFKDNIVKTNDLPSVLVEKTREFKGDTKKAFEYYKFTPMTEDGKGIQSEILKNEIIDSIDRHINILKQELNLDRNMLGPKMGK